MKTEGPTRRIWLELIALLLAVAPAPVACGERLYVVDAAPGGDARPGDGETGGQDGEPLDAGASTDGAREADARVRIDGGPVAGDAATAQDSGTAAYPCVPGDLFYVGAWRPDVNDQNVSVSANGRLIAFDSGDALVPEDTNGVWDSYVLDRLTGGLERISVDSSGRESRFDSRTIQVSDDGRHVLFASAGSFNPAITWICGNAYLRDRWSGTTELVSRGYQGSECNVKFGWPVMSRDGNVVAWPSASTSILASDANGGEVDIYVFDRRTGVTERANVNDLGEQSQGLGVDSPAISSDGRFVAFQAMANNLTATPISAHTTRVYVRDRLNRRTEVVSTSTTGELGNAATAGPLSISADGRYVAFESGATNLVPGEPRNGYEQLFVKDRLTGTLEVGVTTPVDPEDSNLCHRPVLSPNARFLAFSCQRCDLAGDRCESGVPTFYIRRLGTQRLWRVAFVQDFPPVSIASSRIPVPQWSGGGDFFSFGTEQPLPPTANDALLDGFVYSFCGGG